MTAVLGNGKVEPCNCIRHASPARSTLARSSSIEKPKSERFAADKRNQSLSDSGRRLDGCRMSSRPSAARSRPTIWASRHTRTFRGMRRRTAWYGAALMVVNAVGDGKRVAFQFGQGAPWEALQPRSIPIDVIVDLNRMNMTYFPHFPRVQQALLPPTTPAQNAGRSDSGVLEEQAVEEASRCFSCGTCKRLRQLLPGLPEPCIVRSTRSNGLYKILVDMQRLPRVH